MKRTIVRVLQTPLLHFLLLGGVLFTLDARRGTPLPPARPQIVLTAGAVAQLRDDWVRTHGVAPNPATEAELLADAVDEEILYREALALGLDRRDPAVRVRLRRLSEFLGEEATDAQRPERDPRALDLARGDIVIRRHLVELMRLAATRLGPETFPPEDGLRAWYERHGTRFAAPERIRLTQIYLSRDRRQGALATDAAMLLDELRRFGVTPELAPARGDAFVHGASPGLVSPAELARLFGPSFATAIENAPLGQWSGPVASSYGLHLVWIHERLPAEPPPFAAVHSQALHQWLREYGEAQARERMRVLRARYNIELPPQVGDTRSLKFR